MHALTQPLTHLSNTQLEQDEALLASLSLFQRVLLVTDGTVTRMLEQYLGESIKALKLHECIESRLRKLPEAHRRVLDANILPVLQREILLQGQTTLNNWVYAESSLVLNHIPLDFRQDLFASREPIGKLWSKYRVETRKTILETGKESAGKLAEHFNIHADDEILYRTYSVHSGGMITMLITEKFPTCFFLDE